MTPEEYRDLAGHLSALIAEVEALPYPRIRESVFELLETIDSLHREALERWMVLVREHGGPALADRAAGDPIVGTLLRLYDLLPAAPHGAPAPPGPSGFVPLVQLEVPPRPPAWPEAWEPVAPLEAVPPGALHPVQVGGRFVLLANIEGEIFAVQGHCPGSMAPLYLGRFAPPCVTCPWHHERFDVRTGKRVEGGPGADLEVLPVTLAEGGIWLPGGRGAGAPGGAAP